MNKIRLNTLSISQKIFVSAMLCVAGFSYIALLGSIYIDTNMEIANIIKGYGSQDWTELTIHSFTFLHWFVATFSLAGAIFLISSYSEKIKTVFALIIPASIIVDIAAQWVIGMWKGFAYILFACGIILALSFLTMFVLTQYDIWLNKKKD